MFIPPPATYTSAFTIFLFVACMFGIIKQKLIQYITLDKNLFQNGEKDCNATRKNIRPMARKVLNIRILLSPILESHQGIFI